MRRTLWAAFGVVLATAIAAFGWASDRDASPTVVYVNDASSFAQALQRPRHHTTIELAAGDYGTLRLDDRTWNRVVIRASAPTEVRFNSIELRRVTGLELRNVSVTGRVDATATNDFRLVGTTVGDGVYLRDGSHHIEIRENIIKGGRFGVWIQSRGTSRSHDVVVADNEISGQTGDNVQIGPCDDMVLEDNTIADITDNADHNDGIQVMGGENITIRRNRLTGQDQAILLKPEPGALGAGTIVRHIRVENNVITHSRGAGIIVAGATDVEIVNNTGVGNRFADIHLEDDNPGLDVWNNAVRQIHAQQPQTAGFSHNNCVLIHNAPGPTDIVTTPSLTSDHRVIMDTSCARAATPDGAPSEDFDRSSRGSVATAGALIPD